MAPDDFLPKTEDKCILDTFGKFKHNFVQPKYLVFMRSFTQHVDRSRQRCGWIIMMRSTRG